MPGERDAADAGRSDGGEQARLLAVGGRHTDALDAVLAEIVLDEANERNVALVARRVEGDELASSSLAAVTGGAIASVNSRCA